MDKKDLSKLDTLESFRKFLYEIAAREESFKLEIYALRKTLEIYANPKTPSDPSLEETVTYLMKDPIVKKLVHVEFEPIIRQIDDLVEETKLLQLLSSWNPKGPAN